jgi:excinuclease ABC subunit C
MPSQPPKWARHFKHGLCLLDARRTDRPAVSIDASSLPACGGVYAFVDADGELVQLLRAQNIRRSVTHRLTGADPDRASSRADLRSITRSVWWTPAHSVFESMLTYLHTARRLLPDTYRRDLNIASAWFATVRLDNALPRWQPESRVPQRDAVHVGPFARKNQCQTFVTLLEDLFDLCRYHRVLDQAPHGERCSYYDMARCPAPCDGTISLDDYCTMVRASIDYACGRFDDHHRSLEEKMNTAAADRQYARAAATKETLDRGIAFVGTHPSAGRTLEDFQYLVVQRGETPSRVKPFFVHQGMIVAGDSVRICDIDRSTSAWIDRIRASSRTDSDRKSADSVCTSEHIAIVVHFLNKSNDAPGLFLHVSDLSTPDNLARQIRERFSAKRNLPDKSA